MRVIEISSGKIDSTELAKDLHGAAHLTGVDAGAHHRAKGPNVEEIIAHEFRDCLGLIIERGISRVF